MMEMPCAFPDHPQAQQQIRNGMGGHGIAEPIAPQNQCLIQHSAKDSRKPFIVRQAKYASADEEWNPGEAVERDGFKVGPLQVAIMETQIADPVR